MNESKLNLIISLHEGDGVSDEKLFQATGYLQQQLAQAGADSVRRAQTGDLPVGAKGVPIDLNTLIVSLGSAGVVTALIQLLQQWVLRKAGRQVKVKAQAGDQSFEFEYFPDRTSPDELVALASKLTQLMHKPSIEIP